MPENSGDLITTLAIDEFWAFERKAEPVRLGAPLPEGRVRDPAELAIFLGGRPVPLQARELTRWRSDGSLRWALLDFQTDVAFRRKPVLELRRVESSPPFPPPRLNVTQTANEIRVDTGPFACGLPRCGAFRIEGIQCQEAGGLPEGTFVTLDVTERRHGPLSAEVTGVEVLAAGPVLAEMIVTTALSTETGKEVLDAEITLRFHTGKPRIEGAVTFISREQDLHLVSAALCMTGFGEESAEIRRFGGRKGTDTSIRYDFDTVRDGHGTVFEDSPVANWVSYRSPSGGALGTIRKARYRFDKEISVDREGIRLHLWPLWAKPYHLYPWMAMTNEVLFEFHPPGTPDYELAKDCYLFERLVKPMLPPEYYRECRALGDIFPSSRKYQVFEGMLARALKHRPKGIGQMHFGDEPSGIYTAEGRGKGGLLFTNGEYDFPHLLFAQYARTGHRHWWEMAEAAAMHWLDVDWLRNAENPLYAGGVACHEVDHRSHPAAGPSHEWAGGFLDFYHLTGNRTSLRAARSVADNVAGYIENGRFDRVGTYQMRELGWALTALAAVYEETREERHREAGIRAATLVETWRDTFGTISEVQRFTDGPDAPQNPVLPIAVYRDNFSSITINGLRRFGEAAGHEPALRLFLEEAEGQLEWFNSVEGWGEQRETRYPMLETFAHSFLRTGNREFLDAGMRILRFGLTNGELRFETIKHRRETALRGYDATYIEPHAVPINSQLLALTVTPMLAFLQVAEDEGVLGCLATMDL